MTPTNEERMMNALAAQRNQALDNAAVLTVQLSVLATELEDLKKAHSAELRADKRRELSKSIEAAGGASEVETNGDES